ncbi:MAG: glutathione S-transferase N-terminal domain-containing protein [Pseudomonadota bacterium]
MASTAPVRLVGATASPYSQKMVGLLRYRQIPYAITWGSPEAACEALGVAPPKPVLMPIFFFEDDAGTRAVTDSTPIIRQLEQMYQPRSVIPVDPALAFIDYLIEDFGDEWCTKYMFHYRWYCEADADNAGTLLPLGVDVRLGDEQLAQFKAFFSDRQIGRLYVVGSNDTTAPVIDASYRRFLAAMQAHLGEQRFMLGNRPGAGDFGVYGQLTQLVGFDPTPRNIAHEVSPRTVAWVNQMADQSGLQPLQEDWIAVESQPETLKTLLREIGRVYVPAQLANARAYSAGEKTWECEIDDAPWTQQTFPYQAKCLQWTREQYHALTSEDKSRVDTLIAGTGIEAMLTPSA